MKNVINYIAIPEGYARIANCTLRNNLLSIGCNTLEEVLPYAVWLEVDGRCKRAVFCSDHDAALDAFADMVWELSHPDCRVGGKDIRRRRGNYRVINSSAGSFGTHRHHPEKFYIYDEWPRL